MKWINKSNVQRSLRQVFGTPNQNVRGGGFYSESVTGSCALPSSELDGITSGDFGSARRNDTRLYGEEPFHILTFFWGPAV